MNVQGSVVVALNGDNDNNARRDADMAAYQQSKNNNNNNNRGLVAPADQENQDATSFSFQIALAPNEKGGEETKAMTLRKEGPTESTNGDGGMKAVAVLAMVAFAATVFMLTSSWMISHNKKQASSQ